MVYIIYNKNRFVGYTEDKLMLENFMKYRKGKYSYKKVKKTKIPKRILNSKDFEIYSLDYYVGYRITTELPLFLYEFEPLEDSLHRDIFTLSESLYSFLLIMKYLRFTKEEERIIKISLEYLIQVIENVSLGHEPIFDEVIDLVQYFNTKK